MAANTAPQVTDNARPFAPETKVWIMFPGAVGTKVGVVVSDNGGDMIEVRYAKKTAPGGEVSKDVAAHQVVLFVEGAETPKLANVAKEDRAKKTRQTAPAPAEPVEAPAEEEAPVQGPEVEVVAEGPAPKRERKAPRQLVDAEGMRINFAHGQNTQMEIALRYFGPETTGRVGAAYDPEARRVLPVSNAEGAVKYLDTVIETLQGARRPAVRALRNKIARLGGIEVS